MIYIDYLSLFIIPLSNQVAFHAAYLVSKSSARAGKAMLRTETTVLILTVSFATLSLDLDSETDALLPVLSSDEEGAEAFTATAEDTVTTGLGFLKDTTIS